jgi:predicted permease
MFKLNNLTNQTAAASLLQFFTMVILGVPNTIVNIVTTCNSSQNSCVSNTIVTLIFYLLTAGWFGIIMLVGFIAQRKRSRQFAVLLGGLEFITLGVAGYIDYPHDTNVLAKATSLIDAVLSIVVIYLALRLFYSGGRRIVKKPLVTRSKKRL